MTDTRTRWSSDPYPNFNAEVNDSIAFSGLTVEYLTHRKARVLVSLTSSLPSSLGIKSLDVGCGIGNIHPLFGDRLGRLYGVDVAQGALDKAARANPSVCYKVYSGSRLPFDDSFFDFCYSICVLHHIAPAKWLDFMREIHRVTKTSGLVAIIEHNPFNPLTLLAVNRCSFDRDAVLLKSGMVKHLLNQAGFEELNCRYMLFTPFRGSWAERLDDFLGFLPVGAQYLVSARKTDPHRPAHA
jgi:ubiquinone/menaquinone biosynthesis C-methylase UbiE